MVSQSPVTPDNGLYTLIVARTGLVMSDHQRNDVAALLDKLAAEVARTETLYALLAAQPMTHPFWQRIIHVITVGETYFFRNQAQFNALRSHVLPPIIQERRKSGSKQLRLWSAGSSTGEEVYSLAIMLREMLPDIESWSITLLATDINHGYLEQARRGVFRQRSFRNETPDDLRARWFTAEKDGYRLNSPVRNMVLFAPLNLVSDDFPSFATNTMVMDVILCRNVTIYFDRETTRGIARRFQKALNPNGWLVVGHSEPQADLYEGFVARNFKDTVLYQKTTETPAPLHFPTPVETKRPTDTLRTPAATPPKVTVPAPVIAPPAPPKDFMALAKTAADREHWDEARAWLDKAEQQNRMRAEVHYLRALVEINSGHRDLALQLLRRAIYCDGTFALAHYTLGDLYRTQGAHKEAARHWQLALNSVDTSRPDGTLPFSEDLTVEMFVELLTGRLAGLHPFGES